MTNLPTPPPEEARVGDYRLLALIGEGGMGVVHLALAPDGRRVALKVLRPHVVGDVEARGRLAREVSSLRRIISPRIAEILDADPHGPVPFVVTRYVPGLSLYHHVAEEGPVEGADLLHFADGLAEALEAVHRVGVLHRDVKPTNVLMEGRSPVLIDFGLARLADDARFTQAGWLLGTPGYLAPEILYGDEATPAADVHAWAATVAYAATGRPPYGTGPAMAVMDRVRRGEHNLQGVPDPVAELLRAGLSPEPLQRPTVAELRSTVRELQHVARMAARPAPAPELWTMPFAPAARAAPAGPVSPSADPAPVTRVLPPDPAPAAPSPVVPSPVVPVPAQPPEAVTEPAPVSPPARDQFGDQVQPGPAPWLAPTPRESSRPQQLLQLVGLGALSGALVAYAPYLGTALVTLVVLGLRTASVARQRHGRRRLIRGRPRWYDAPTTAVSTPGYLLLASFGTVSLIAGAGLTALAMLSLGYLFGQPAAVGLLLAGIGFAPALWWGPGSGRVRETTRGLVRRTSRSEFGGWVVAGACLLGTAVLVGLLLGDGPNWAPSLAAPWG